MSDQRQQTQYTKDEVGSIIDVALRLEDLTKERKRELREGITYDQLVEIAAEFGISEDAVVRAIDERSRTTPATRRTSPLDRWRAFKLHLASYVSVVAGLTVIDRADGGFEWVFYPAAGWGMWVVLHGLVTWFLGDESPPMALTSRRRR